MNSLCRALKWMPLVLCVFTPVSVFITYGIAVGAGHVVPLWPYISDTGTEAPESCVFSLLLNAAAYLLCAIVYLKYCEVSEFVKIEKEAKISPLWNRLAACSGFVSCFGLDLVANFQETKEFLVHIIGALTCFFSGTFYFFIQTVLTYRMHPRATVLLWTRVVFTFLNVLFIIGTFAPLQAAMLEFKGTNVLKWTPKDGGFTYHAISTVSEWLLMFSFCGYMCTLFWDFRRIDITPPKIKFLNMMDLTSEETNRSESQEVPPESNHNHVWI